MGRKDSPLLERTGRSGLAPCLAPLIASMIGLVGGASGRACELKLFDLLRSGPARSAFDQQLIELSRSLEGMRANFVLQDAKASAAAAGGLVDRWMETYVARYLSPAPGFETEKHWRPLMDSVGGPLQRIRDHLAAGRFDPAHDQLKLLQSILAEFHGFSPKAEAGLGSVAHTVATLQAIGPWEPRTANEWAARVLLLRARFDAWRAAAAPGARDMGATLAFEALLTALEKTLAAKPDPGAVPAAAAALVAPSARLVRHAALAVWGLPPPTDLETKP